MRDQNNINGKICMVTGATSGIGKVTARALAQRGATVIVVGRNQEKGTDTINQIKQQTGNSAIEFLLADLSSQKEIHQLAQQFKNRYKHLDVLINNAGLFLISYKKSADGIEMTFAVNHLSYFLLTNLLLDRIKASAPARIINVSSGLHAKGVIDFGNLQGEKGYSGTAAYNRSKLANILFTYELARRLEGTNVTVNALHPGLVATNLTTNNGWLFKHVIRRILNLGALSEEEGAQTSIYLATSPEVESVTGKYFVKQKAVLSSQASYDKAVAGRLWQVSEKLAGLPVST